MDCFALLDAHTIGLIRKKLAIEDRINLDKIIIPRFGQQLARMDYDDLRVFNEIIFTQNEFIIRKNIEMTLNVLLKTFTEMCDRVLLYNRLIAYLCRPNTRACFADNRKFIDCIINKMDEFAQQPFTNADNIKCEFEFRNLCATCAQHYRAMLGQK